MKKSVAVLGLGKFGSSIARSLAKGGAEVLAVDKDEDLVIFQWLILFICLFIVQLAF